MQELAKFGHVHKVRSLIRKTLHLVSRNFTQSATQIKNSAADYGKSCDTALQELAKFGHVHKVRSLIRKTLHLVSRNFTQSATQIKIQPQIAENAHMAVLRKRGKNIYKFFKNF